MSNAMYAYELYRDSLASPSCWSSPNNTCAPHFHSALEVVYVRKGMMEATLNGKLHQIGEGELLLVPSYNVHRYVTPTQSDTLVLTVPMAYISSFQKVLNSKSFMLQHIENNAFTKEVGRCMQRCSSLNRNAPGSMAIRGYIHVILALLTENIPMEDSGKQADDALVRKILTYLHDNYINPLSLKSIASEFGYSASRFSHIFNQHVGCSISEYINALRCRHAAAALLEGEDSVTQVAMGAGFNSMRTFYRAFIHVFGVTPSKYAEVSKGNSALLHPSPNIYKHMFPTFIAQKEEEKPSPIGCEF